MGKEIAKKIRGLSWKAKLGLILSFTVFFSVFMYQGWFTPKGLQAIVPNVRAVGSVLDGTGVITPPMPTGVMQNDILLLFVETAAQATSVSGGTETWAEVTTPVTQGTATTGTTLSVFWARASQDSPTAPSIADSGDHQTARMIAIEGVITSGSPIDVVATSTESTSDTSVSFPAVTTTVADALVVVAMAGNLPDSSTSAGFSGWTNAALTNLAEQIDSTENSGNGGALGVAVGGKTAAGATGTTTATLTTAATKAMMTFALKPRPADTTPPAIGTVNVTPTSNSYTTSAPTVTASVTESDSTVTGCEYTTNGSTWVSGTLTGVSPSWTCTGTPTGLSGSLTINVRATNLDSYTGTGTQVSRTVDSTAPTDGTLQVAPGNQQNVLTWTAATDPSGIQQYDVRYADGSTPPANCSAGTSIYTGTNLTYTHGSLTNGLSYAYRVCAYDNLGNPPSTGVTGTGTPISGTPNTVSATRTVIASAATSSTIGVIMQRLTVNSDTVSGSDNRVVLNSLTIDDNTATSNQYAAVRIYVDTTSSATLPATAKLIGGKSRWDGASTVISLNGATEGDRSVNAGTPKYLYIVYDMAYDQSAKTVQSRITNIGVAAPDNGATVSLLSNSFTLTAGSTVAVITSCTNCHTYPPADATGNRNVPVGSVVGSHSEHSAAVCSSCHVVPATETNADFGHRTGTIQFAAGIGYSRGTSFNQANDLSGTNLGTCSTASCHDAYGIAGVATPKWGTDATCSSCHAAGGDGSPGTGSHATHMALGGAACSQCHSGATAGSSGGTAHLDTNIDVTNGYPANVTKHAAGSYTGTCSTASCHANVYGTGTATTPVWGISAGCDSCHSAYPISANGPATGSHAIHMTGGAACTSCHNAGTTATTSPGTGHTDGNIDVTAGYPANVTKHAAGSYTGSCSNAICHANVYGTGTITTPVWGVASGCGACHSSYPISATGPATGSHTTHMNGGAACVDCHNTGTTATTSPTTGHADGNIDVIAGYPANITKHAAGTYTGTCSNATCHANVYGSGSITSPVWGASAGCDACHTVAIGANGPATGSHTAHAGSACTQCHNTGTTATSVPTIAHGDGNIDILAGYPANVAKHAAGTYTGTCTTATCHANVYGTGTVTTPVWGTASGCETCHTVTIGANGPATGSHTAHAGSACTQCHNTGTTQTTAPSTAHADGNIDILAGYPANVTKHAAGTYTGTCTTATCHANVYGTGTTTTPVWGAASGCEACHTTYPISANGPATGAHTAHAGRACTNCHAAGTTATSVPSTGHADGNIDINATGYPVNITKHTAGTYSGTCTSNYCHSSGQSTTGGATPVYAASPLWSATSTTCGSCHLDFNSNASATGDHVKHAQGTANLACAYCHSGYTETSVATATHVNNTIEVVFNSTYATTYSQGSGPVGNGYGTCSASKCHGQGAPVWGGALYSTTLICENCHGSATGTFYSTAATGAAPTKTTDPTNAKVGAHTAHLNAGNISSPIACTECHAAVTSVTSPATHMDGSTSFTWGTLAKTGALTPSIATSTCSNVYCHGKAMPGGDTTGTDITPTWTDTAYLNTTLNVASCGKCHGFPPSTASGHPTATAPTGFPTTNCSCHSNMSGTGTTYANIFVNKALHINGIYEPSAGGDCLGCHSTLVNADFVRPSRHVSNGTTSNIVTNFDCIVCHAEGDTTSSGSTISTTALHSMNSTGPVDLRNVDSSANPGTANTNYWVWPGRRAIPLAKGSANTTYRNNMDTFCMNCHDANGASTIAVNNSNNGLTLGASVTSTVRTVTGTGNTNTNNANLAQRPFNTNDKLQNTRDTGISGSGTPTIGTHRLTTYGRVVNVKSQFNSGNAAGTNWASHHNLNQFTKRYTTNNTTAGTGLPTTIWTNYVTKENFTLNGTGSGTGTNAGLHCSDCHLNEVNAHGSVNSWYMLAGKTTASDTDVAPTLGNSTTTAEISCFRCHSATQYAVGGGGTAGRVDHSTRCNNIDVVTGTAVEAPFGNMCHACHGGFGDATQVVNQDVVGTGSTLKGRGALGAIHGNNETYTPGGGSSTKRYRFISGASMRFWNPNSASTPSWEAPASNAGSCYTISSADQWGSCTQHTGARSATTRAQRALTY